MATGLPIVSTNAGGVSELVGKLQSKFIVSKDDPDSFSLCLQKMVFDKKLRHSLSKENFRYVKRFSTEKIAAMYDTVLFS